jgi:effector-binding domain-containing protein/uncharacterized protein YndB with AHSA1/START domain
MRILRNFILIILTLIVIGAIYLATLDGRYKVERSRVINASPILVFNELNEYKNWKEWSPWYELDSTIEVRYGDSTKGEGGYYSWTSEIEGGGRMKTLKVTKPKRIDQELFFETPFGDMRSDVNWELDKTPEGTDVKWSISGELPFFSRFMASDMEAQLGPMEERGLELFDDNLQRKLRVYTIDSIGVVDYSGGFYVYTTASSKISDMSSKMTSMLQLIEGYIEKHHIRLTGNLFTLYHKFDQENGTTMFSVAHPVAERVLTEDPDILTGFMDRGTYFKTVLKGDYSNSKEAWEKAVFYASNAKGYELLENGEPFEVFVNNPENTPNPAELITEIYIPVKAK